jgi:hypothetical protein
MVSFDSLLLRTQKCTYLESWVHLEVTFRVSFQRQWKSGNDSCLPLSLFPFQEVISTHTVRNFEAVMSWAHLWCKTLFFFLFFVFCFLFFFFLETGFLCAILAVLELTL